MHIMVAEARAKLVHFCFNSIWLFLQCYDDDRNRCNLPLYRNGLSEEMKFEIKNNRNDLLWVLICGGGGGDWSGRKLSVLGKVWPSLAGRKTLWKENQPWPHVLPSRSWRTMDKSLHLAAPGKFHKHTTFPTNAVVENALVPFPQRFTC